MNLDGLANWWKSRRLERDDQAIGYRRGWRVQALWRVGREWDRERQDAGHGARIRACRRRGLLGLDIQRVFREPKLDFVGPDVLFGSVSDRTVGISL
jgi:hypothetical protein